MSTTRPTTTRERLKRRVLAAATRFIKYEGNNERWNRLFLAVRAWRRAEKDRWFLR
jgi:hypothetical protein